MTRLVKEIYLLLSTFSFARKLIRIHYKPAWPHIVSSNNIPKLCLNFSERIHARAVVESCSQCTIRNETVA